MPAHSTFDLRDTDEKYGRRDKWEGEDDSVERREGQAATRRKRRPGGKPDGTHSPEDLGKSRHMCVHINTPIATGLLTGHPKQYDNLTAGGWALKAGKGPASPAGGGDNTDKPYHSSRELFLGLNIHVFSSIFWQNIECSR